MKRNSYKIGIKKKNIYNIVGTGVNSAGDAGDTSPNILVGGTSTGISPDVITYWGLSATGAFLQLGPFCDWGLSAGYHWGLSAGYRLGPFCRLPAASPGGG